MALFRKKKGIEIDPDEIFVDSVNLPDFDDQQFEGRIERSIPKGSVYFLVTAFGLVFSLFIWKAAALQVTNGEWYANRSSSNTLREIPVYGERGLIVDRKDIELASNSPTRSYITDPGFAHVLGYVGYPTEQNLKDASHLSPEEYVGKAGVEKAFNDELRGVTGMKLVEVNAKGEVASENVYQPPLPGSTLHLSIDSKVQKKLFEIIKSVADERGFSGGSGVIMDVHTGEIIAMTSYPEYNPEILSAGKDREYISKTLNDSKNNPLLDRAISGIYTPGSVVKPFMAVAALAEKVISPLKEILSTGSISIQNPYDKTKKTVFKDWRAQGYVDMRHALAVSSDVYFYEIGGGFEGQKGLGIANIEKYMKIFGFGEKTGIELDGEGEGVIPSPEWKAANFNGEDWYIGDTYHTSIGQYGFGVTPLQMVRALSVIANDGTLLTPTILKQESSTTPVTNGRQLGIDKSYYKVAREGMRLSVQEGTAKGLDIPQIEIGGKTGTAELGVSKGHVNSWVEGFWPYENPRYAFVVVMEHGVVHNTIGGVFVMRQFFDWLSVYGSEYY